MVSVRFFASLAERVGTRVEEVAIEPQCTARDVWNLSVGDQIVPESINVAINKEYASWDSPVSEGDEVAFFPTVTGG